MPLPQWLRSLFRLPQPEIAPPNFQQEPVVHAAPAALPVDNGVRAHLAANDPEFPAKREAAVGIITAAIDEVAQAHGFTTKARSWAKAGPLGVVTLHLQRSPYGFEAYINLGFQPETGEADGPWVQDDFIRLGQFYPANAPENSSVLIYLDVCDDPSILAEPMQILRNNALPWLASHLTDPEAPKRPFPA